VVSLSHHRDQVQDDPPAPTMASLLDPFDPFDPSNVLIDVEPLSEEGARWHGFQLDTTLQNATFYLPDVQSKPLDDLQLGAFALDDEPVALPSIAPSSASSSSSLEDDDGRKVDTAIESRDYDLLDNIWTSEEVIGVQKPSVLNSWDRFVEEEHIEPPSGYLSEASPAVFDAVIASSTRSASSAGIVGSDLLLASLHALILARSSLLFYWDEKEGRFTQTVASFATSGYTPVVIQDVVHSIASIGSTMKKLSNPNIYFLRPGSQPSPSELAYLSTLRSCVMAIKTYVHEQQHSLTSILKFLQLHSSVQPLVKLLETISRSVQRSSDDHGLLSTILIDAPNLLLQYPRFHPVIDLFLSSIAQPLLRGLYSELGLRINEHHSRNTPAPNIWDDVLPGAISKTVNEVIDVLVLVKEQCPSILAKLNSHIKTNDDLDLAFSWPAVIQAQQCAGQFEQDLQALVVTQHSHDASQTDFISTSLNTPNFDLPEIENPFSVADIGAHLPPLADIDSPARVTLQCLTDSQPSVHQLSVPYDQVLSHSIGPVLSAQHRLLSYSVFDVLFKEHNLGFHLNLLHRFQLLADGVFATRLSLALFDPNQNSGEGRRTTGMDTGLRLHARDTWPPASSELRLVLMGILSDSLRSTPTSQAQLQLPHLEETISFAIRDLSDDEMDLCRDVNSIHALDFLKIHYRAPNPLVEAIISLACLEKYDRIFKHLLRLLRVRSVTQGMLRAVTNRHNTSSPRTRTGIDNETHRFLIEMHTLLTFLTEHTHSTIRRLWTPFSTLISQIQDRLEARDYHGLGIARSVKVLGARLEGTLDAILEGLLLMNRQLRVRDVLERVLGSVLRYAADSRKTEENVGSSNITATEPESGSRSRNTRKEFRDQVNQFLTLLEESVASQELKVGTRDAVTRDIELPFDLLREMSVRLDFNGYWMGD
jgi:Gamma tubulin complex component C-terminal